MIGIKERGVLSGYDSKNALRTGRVVYGVFGALCWCELEGLELRQEGNKGRVSAVSQGGPRKER